MASQYFDNLTTALNDAVTRETLMKKAPGVFQFDLKNIGGSINSYTLDLRKGHATKGAASDAKPDVVIIVGEDDFLDLASGKLSGKPDFIIAFTSGKLKTKGQMMLATKLDGVLKAVPAQGSPASPAQTSPLAKKGSATEGKQENSNNSADLNVPSFKSSAIFVSLKNALDHASPSEKEALTASAKGVFQFDVKGKDTTQSWTADLKQYKVYKGKPPSSPDVVMTLPDADLVALAAGQTTGQKLFMAGKLKLKGAMMLATKLDTVFKKLTPKAKL